MDIGGFGISLTVNDINRSKTFYEKLGFKQFHGDITHNWIIMKNGDHTIGLFQDMFEKNIMTFNPGWDNYANPLETFTDVREIQKRLKAQGIEIENEVDENGAGPANFIVYDPDGNPILFDQHV